MASSSCSHWWHAPIYLTLSLVLAFIAISTSLHSPQNSTTQPTIPTRPLNLLPHQLPFNASRALRASGFNIVATLLQISPETFLSSPKATIFAIKDSAFNITTPTSLSPWFLKQLLQYHTSPSRLSMAELLRSHQGSCFPTLLGNKYVSVTKIDAGKRVVEVNQVLVSHPDLFLDVNVAIHGVLGPFSPMKSQDLFKNWDPIQAPTCNVNSSPVLDVGKSKNMNHLIEWTKIVRVLSFKGFVSFAIGLNSVLDRILEDYEGLDSVTIFTPPEFAFVTSPEPILDKIVRSHILPKRVTFAQLSSLPDKAVLRTLTRDQNLEIANNATIGFAINGVEIVAPEIVVSEKFIVHGISRAFALSVLPNSS